MPGEAPETGRIALNAIARHEILLEIGDDQTLRAQNPRRHGHEDLAHPERDRDIPGMQRPGATEGHQGELARVVSALHRYGADRAHHVGHHDAEHAVRGALDVESESFGDRREGGPRDGFFQLHLAGEQAAARQSPEHKVRIRHRGPVAAPPVARGTRVGSGARGADLEQSVAIEPRDRAPARSDRLDVDRREAYGEAGDVALERDIGPEVPDQRDVGARAPHVEGDDVAPPGLLRRVGRTNHTGRGPRQRGAHRQGPRPLRRHQTAARLIDADGRIRRHAREPLLEGRHVACQHRLEVRVQHRGGEPLVFAELRLDLERCADRNVRQGRTEGGRDPVLVLRIAEREQQTDRAGLGLARAYLLHRRGDGVAGELGDRFAGRVHPLGDLEPVAALDERRRVILGE